jgi:hypothetical protein
MRLANIAAVGLLFLSALGLELAAYAAFGSTPTSAIYVANLRGYVTLYSLGSDGDVAPVSTIGGAATRMGRPEAIALDSKGNIYVTCDNRTIAGGYAGDSVVVFSAGSKGNASPIAIIAGSHTTLRGVHSIAVDSMGSIFVGAIEPAPTGVRIFAAGSDGDVKPRAAIGGLNGSTPLFENPNGVAVDLRGQLLVANGSDLASGSGVLFFPAGSDGDVRPSSTISGAKTGIDWPAGIALDSGGNIYVANAGRRGFPADIRLYSAGRRGDVPPIATISGSNTGLEGRTVRGIALDSEENLYVTSDGRNGTASSITVFKAGSSGNVKPIARISGDNTGLSAAVGIAIGPYPNTP